MNIKYSAEKFMSYLLLMTFSTSEIQVLQKWKNMWTMLKNKPHYLVSMLVSLWTFLLTFVPWYQVTCNTYFLDCLRKWTPRVPSNNEFCCWFTSPTVIVVDYITYMMWLLDCKMTTLKTPIPLCPTIINSWLWNTSIIFSLNWIMELDFLNILFYT